MPLRTPLIFSDQFGSDKKVSSNKFDVFALGLMVGSNWKLKVPEVKLFLSRAEGNMFLFETVLLASSSLEKTFSEPSTHYQIERVSLMLYLSLKRI